jgi:hygromycin-B 4-O-kinase
MGGYAARINSIPTEGFGGAYEWSQERFSPHATWADYLRDELHVESRFQMLESCRMLKPSQIAKVRAVLETAGTNRQPTLTHGDLRLKNILVDEDGHITSILDWETCTSNLAPEWELSIALHDLSIDEKQEFIAGYGLDTAAIIGIAPLVKALNLMNYEPPVKHAAEAKNLPKLERYRMRLSGALDLYSL